MKEGNLNLCKKVIINLVNVGAQYQEKGLEGAMGVLQIEYWGTDTFSK